MFLMAAEKAELDTHKSVEQREDNRKSKEGTAEDEAIRALTDPTLHRDVVAFFQRHGNDKELEMLKGFELATEKVTGTEWIKQLLDKAATSDSPAAKLVSTLSDFAKDPESVKRLSFGADVISGAVAGSALTLDALSRTRELADKFGLRQEPLSKEDRAKLERVVTDLAAVGNPIFKISDLGTFAEAASQVFVAGAKALGIDTGKQLTDDEIKKITDLSDAELKNLFAKVSAEAKGDDPQSANEKPAEAGQPAEGENGAAGEPAATTDAPVPVDTPTVGTAEFAAKAKELFPRVDTDGDGYLSETELALAMQSDQYKGQDAQVVAALHKMRSELEELNDDETGDENDGVTAGDLNKFNEKEAQYRQDYQDAVTAKDWLDKPENLSKVDSDGDGFLTESELNQAAAKTDLSADDKKAIEYLRAKRGEIQEASNDETGFENDGITLADMKKYVDETIPKSDNGKLLGGVQGAMWRTAESQKTVISTELYANPENPIENIKPDAIRQGTLGNCYFLAALASVAATDPESIQKMIKDNKDGTYTVTFPGAPDEPITVAAPTAQEMGLYNGGSKEGAWACVIEKAYGQYCQQSVFRRSPFNLGGGDTPQEGSDGGAVTNNATRLLTGRDVDGDNLTLSSKAETARKLEEAFSAKPPRAVTAGINNWFGEKTADGWPLAHAYSVVGFEPDGKGGGTVVVRNPWGGTDGTTSGTKRISLDEFMKNFSSVAYSEKE